MACGAGLFFTATVGALMAVTVLKLSRVQRTVLDRVRVGSSTLGGVIETSVVGTAAVCAMRVE